MCRAPSGRAAHRARQLPLGRQHRAAESAPQSALFRGHVLHTAAQQAPCPSLVPPLFGPKSWPPGPPRAPRARVEAVFLHKPICVALIPAQFEQWLKRRRGAKAELWLSLCSHHGGKYPGLCGRVAGPCGDLGYLFAARQPHVIGQPRRLPGWAGGDTGRIKSVSCRAQRLNLCLLLFHASCGSYPL